MTQINYDEIRTVLTAAGYTMSAAGSQWTAQDQEAYVQYTKLHWPLTLSTILQGQAYSEILPDGFPGKNEPTPPVRTLLSIAIAGASTVVEGEEITLTATGTYNLAPLTEDVTATATWTSGTEANATVAAGVVTGVAAGSSNITAAVGSVTSPAHAVTVTAAPVRELLSIAITGTLTAEEGATSQLTATGTYNLEPLTEDVTTSATWASATPANATVGASTGLVTGVAAGTSDITATIGSVVSPAATFTVTAP